jgi:hypothetical protein
MPLPGSTSNRSLRSVKKRGLPHPTITASKALSQRSSQAAPTLPSTSHDITTCEINQIERRGAGT